LLSLNPTDILTIQPLKLDSGFHQAAFFPERESMANFTPRYCIGFMAQALLLQGIVWCP